MLQFEGEVIDRSVSTFNKKLAAEKLAAKYARKMVFTEAYFIHMGPTEAADHNCEIWMMARGYVLQFGTWNWMRDEPAIDQEVRMISFMHLTWGYGRKIRKNTKLRRFHYNGSYQDSQLEAQESDEASAGVHHREEPVEIPHEPDHVAAC